RSIKARVSRREMPPWHIDKTVGIQHFKNDISLSDQQIEKIVSWIDAGAPRGDPNDMPPAREWGNGEQWNIGEPELVVMSPKHAVTEVTVAVIHGHPFAALAISGNRVTSHEAFAKPEKAARIISYQPHMHIRGKAMTMDAIYPNGQAQTLSSVDRFDFTWPVAYVYDDDYAPLLPAGTILHTVGIHDNTAANRLNPDPNHWVGFGNRTFD